MNKQTRILTAIAVTIVLGGMFAYQDAQKNEPLYQQHPAVCIATDFFCGTLVGLIFYFGSGWLARLKERKTNQATNSHPIDVNKPVNVVDDKFYDQVAQELQEKPMVPGLWTKAFAEMGGDDAKARALYIKYRVAQLAEASRQRLEEDSRRKKTHEDQQHSVNEATKRQERTISYRFSHAFLGMFFGLFACIFCLGGLFFVSDEFAGSSAVKTVGAVSLFL